MSGDYRNAKGALAPIDAEAILRKVAALPIRTWTFNDDLAQVRHIGPMAQDFAAAFGLGRDDTHIATVDADGVALAAIQGLHQLLAEERARVRDQRHEITELKDALAAQQRQLAQLQQQVAELLAARDATGPLAESR